VNLRDKEGSTPLSEALHLKGEEIKRLNSLRSEHKDEQTVEGDRKFERYCEMIETSVGKYSRVISMLREHGTVE
jgi:hypothetical protein